MELAGLAAELQRIVRKHRQLSFREMLQPEQQMLCKKINGQK